jgi:hypothetical protein
MRNLLRRSKHWATSTTLLLAAVAVLFHPDNWHWG